MTRAEAIVYVQAQAVAAQIELSAMLVTNVERSIQGHSPAYDEKAFMELQEKYCITHNGVLSLFQESLP